MYDTKLLKEAAVRVCANNWTVLGRMAKVDRKTARTFVTTGKAHPEKVYRVAKALGFSVKPNDFSAIMISERPSRRTA